MCTTQKYNEGADHAQNSSQTVNTDPQRPPIVADGWYGSDLFDYLQYADTRQNARRMVRAWFLAGLAQDERDPLLNPCDGLANAYLFQEVDLFLSRPQMPLTANEWHGIEFCDYLRVFVGAEKARQMIQAWFLAHTLQAEGEAPINPCGLRVNVYLFESLDNFLSDLPEKEVRGE